MADVNDFEGDTAYNSCNSGLRSLKQGYHATSLAPERFG